jgi:poly-gamma-glutamate capsule biosynthesis protein CapA/YwtB (metallophosphatase superfamily)
MKILIVGDFYPNLKLKESLLKKSPQEIFGKFSNIILDADLAIVNLESPLTEHNKQINKTGPALKADAKFATFLKESGFGLTTLANNHIMDFGQIGLQDTIQALQKVNLNYVGVGSSIEEAVKPFIFKNEKGEKVAILNFAENEWSTTKGNAPGAAGINIVSNFYSIKKVKEHADFVILITHGGHENFNLPSKQFRDLLRFYVDAGADVVLNHHPHCVSGHEIFNGKPIYYSIGNFIFEGNRDQETLWNKGLAVELDFVDNMILSKHYFFVQSVQGKPFELLENERELYEVKELEKLNSIIQDDERLEEHFKHWRIKSEKYYKINIEPHSNKFLQALQNRKFVPSLWSKRKKLYLLNMLRCESHREMLIDQLENDDSNS